MESWEEYARSVTENKILTCEYVKQSVQRHLKDLEREDIYFDSKAAKTAIGIIEQICIGRGFDEKGKQSKILFTLEPFQSFIVAMIFGWKLEKNDLRRFRYAYIEMARKQGKSTLAAAIAILLFLAEFQSEVYTIATKRDQAKIVFNMAKRLIQETPWLAKDITVQQHNISLLSKYSKFEALSSDARKQDGSNPSCAIVDEFHEHPNWDMYNVMKSGMGSRDQPLLFTITTAGFDKNAPCYHLRHTCTQILNGALEDDSMFVMVFTLDDEDDWEDTSMWGKANPNLGVTMEMDYLLQEFNQAKNSPSQIVNFQTKNLNVWTQSSAVWIKDKDWLSCPGEIDLELLKGASCYGGLDLAKTIDINSLCLLFPNPEAKREEMDFKALWWYWIPEDKVLNNRDNINYTQWVSENWVEVTPGREVDYQYIIKRIADLHTVYNIYDIAYDNYMANSSIVQELEKQHSIIMTRLPQGFKYLSEPTRFIENLVVGRKINHGSNPVSRWMCQNVELQQDPEGNVKMSKSRSKNKIDGMYALADAIAVWQTDLDNGLAEIYYI